MSGIMLETVVIKYETFHLPACKQQGLCLCDVFSHFNSTHFSDFEIHAGDRVFYVHRIVLHQYAYFRGIFASKWLESQTGSITLPEPVAIVEAMLMMMMYGASPERWRRSIRDNPQGLRKIAENAKESDLQRMATPTMTSDGKIDRSSYYSSLDNGISIIPSEVSDFHLFELRHLVLLLRAVEKYMLEDFDKAIVRTFKTLLQDCWFSRGLVQIFKMINDGCTHEDYDPLLEICARGIAQRMNYLSWDSNFMEILGPEMPNMISLIMRNMMEADTIHLHADYRFSSDETACWCQSPECRRMVVFDFSSRRWICRECGRDEGKMVGDPSKDLLGGSQD